MVRGRRLQRREGRREWRPGDEVCDCEAERGEPHDLSDRGTLLIDLSKRRALVDSRGLEQRLEMRFNLRRVPEPEQAHAVAPGIGLPVIFS